MKNTQSSNDRTLPGSPAASPPPGNSAPLTGKAFVAGNGLWPLRLQHGVPTMQSGAERAGTARKPSPESNLSCQRGERAPCPPVTVSNRQIRASARPVLRGEVNKTLSASFGYNNMQREKEHNNSATAVHTHRLHRACGNAHSQPRRAATIDLLR